MKTQRITTIIGRLALATVFLSVAGPLSAKSFDALENLSQEQFREFSENLSAGTHYKAVAPPETLGVLGFDIGLVVSTTDIRGQLFDQASAGGFEGSELIIPRLHVHKGLPFGIDLGASLGIVPDSDASVIGAEARYAIIDGGAVTPAVGLRASYAQVQGLDDFGLKSYALELGISKGVLMFTPYAGIGIVRSTANPRNMDNLSVETYEQRKLLVGVTVNIGIAFTLEAERTDDIRTYSAKLGFRF